MFYPIVDLHCDLLSYLGMDVHKRTIWDPHPRCSYPQLKAGNVKAQTVAISTETEPGSLKKGLLQIEILNDLVAKHSDKFYFLSNHLEIDRIALIPSFENAMAFCSEQEPLKDAFSRLEKIQKILGKIFYISLTWNEENRFGGGSSTHIGLKEEGKELLNFLSSRGIAVDMSHTSDQLAEDILNHIDQHALQIPIMASHSNFRSVHFHERNLPDSIAKEIIQRGGIIGLVLYKKFISDHDPLGIVKHIEHGLKIGAEKALCLGSDYFCVEDYLNNPKIAQDPTKMGFFELYSDASKYPTLLNFLAEEFTISPELLHNLSSLNALAFIQKCIK